MNCASICFRAAAFSGPDCGYVMEIEKPPDMISSSFRNHGSGRLCRQSADRFAAPYNEARQAQTGKHHAVGFWFRDCRERRCLIDGRAVCMVSSSAVTQSAERQNAVRHDRLIPLKQQFTRVVLDCEVIEMLCNAERTYVGETESARSSHCQCAVVTVLRFVC